MLLVHKGIRWSERGSTLTSVETRFHSLQVLVIWDFYLMGKARQNLFDVNCMLCTTELMNSCWWIFYLEGVSPCWVIQFLQYVKNEMILLRASIFLKTNKDQHAAKIFLKDSTIHHFRRDFDIIQYLSNWLCKLPVPKYCHMPSSIEQL